ncbi:hypothetical protein ACFQKO_56955, partial [Nonomuraea rubra]
MTPRPAAAPPHVPATARPDGGPPRVFAFGGLAGGRPHLPAAESLTAWSCLAPALAPGNSAVAFISDHDGSPRVWIQSLQGDAETWAVDTGPQPAVDVSWAPTGTHPAVLVAAGGGEHTQVGTVQPHGGDLRLLS